MADAARVAGKSQLILMLSQRVCVGTPDNDVGRSTDYDIPICHLNLLIKRFFKFRTYSEASHMNNKLREEKKKLNIESKSKYASRSMAAVALK